MRRQAVRITEEHEKRYEKLAQGGIIVTHAINQVAKEFNLSEPHNRQAVRRWARAEGVEFKRGRKGRQRILDKQTKESKIELTEDVILDKMIEALEALKKIPYVEMDRDEWRERAQKALGELKILYNKDSEKEDKKLRLRVAQQQGSKYGD